MPGATARANGEERRERAQRRLEARNAHIATSLSLHAERVAKRSAMGDRPREDSAKERMEALRRRIAAKSEEAAGLMGDKVVQCTLDVMMKATERAGDAVPETGGGSQGMLPVGTTEVTTIHRLRDDKIEFARTAAGDIGAGTASGSEGRTAGHTAGVHTRPAEHGGGGGQDAAAEHAAALAAWHAREYGDRGSGLGRALR